MSTNLGLTEDDFWDDIHSQHEVGERLSADECCLSMNVPIVISYELADMTVTQYGFSQHFTDRDTEAYFRLMKDISSRSINDIIDNRCQSMRLHRSSVKGNLKTLLKRLSPESDPDEQSTIIFHFALYTDKNGASRQSGRRSPRVYFMLGRNGVIFPLFFDPYHEINPVQVRQTE